MGRPRDIVVMGCGPAGLAAALLLRQGGERVTLLDRLEAPAPLGSGLMLQPTGLAVLDRMGLGERLRGLGARIERLFGRAVPSGRVVLDVRYAALGGGAEGLAVHRHALFSTLYGAVAAAGVEVLTRTEIVDSEPVSGGGRALLAKGGRRLGPFDLVVDAAGVRSPLALARRPSPDATLPYGALWATLDWPARGPFDAATLEQRYRRASRMAGVLPIGRMVEGGPQKLAFFWSLRHADHAVWAANGLAAWKAEVRALWPETAGLIEQIERPERLVMARYAHRTLTGAAGPGLVHIGDAAHAASPQLGQGANMALLDAYALGLALARHADVGQALGLYTRLRRRHVLLYQGLTWAFTPVYQSDGYLLPFLRDRLVGPLARVPPAPWLLAMLVAGLVGRPLRGLGLEET